MLEPIKTDISKDKEDAIMRWQEGHNHDKNQIPYMPRGLGTWKIIIPQKFFYRSESYKPHNRLSILRVWQWKELQRIWL